MTAERAKSELARIQIQLRAARSRSVSPNQAAQLQQLDNRVQALASKIEGNKYRPSDESEISAELLDISDLLRDPAWVEPMRDDLGRDLNEAGTWDGSTRADLDREVEKVAVAPGLRGLGLFQSDTLRLRAQQVLDLIDELPAMEGYTPSDFSAEEEREQIRDELHAALAEVSRSADGLSAELRREGTSQAEQDLAFFGDNQSHGFGKSSRPGPAGQTAPDQWLGRLDVAIAALEADRSKLTSAPSNGLTVRTDGLLAAAKRVRAAVAAGALRWRPPTVSR